MAGAYAWPAVLPAAEMLPRLVRLHHERAREEAGGHVRYLCPAYQAPGTEQATLALPTPAAAVTAATTGIGPHAWPTGLVQQRQALREALHAASGPAAEQRAGSGRAACGA